MTRLLFASILAFGLLAATPRAEACGGGGRGLEVVALTIAGLDLAFPLADLRKERLSPMGGRLEMLAMMPQMLVTGGLLGTMAQDGDLDLTQRDVQMVLGFAVLSTACFAHGFWAALRDDPNEPTEPTDHPGDPTGPQDAKRRTNPTEQLAVTPLVVPGTNGTLTGGLGVAGTF